MMSDIAIRAGLDTALLHRAFAPAGRIHVPGFLDSQAAESLHACLSGDLPWQITYNEGGVNYEVPPEDLAALSTPDRARFFARIFARASREFQFLYRQITVHDGRKSCWPDNHPLGRVARFVNSHAFIDFARRVTGCNAITRADAVATCYEPGHFLTSHDDKYADRARRIAFVMNFTKGWRGDWGGNLLFIDDDGHVAEGLVPTFNAINMFRVPQAHAVSLVAPFATQPRLSITGWLMEGAAR